MRNSITKLLFVISTSLLFINCEKKSEILMGDVDNGGLVVPNGFEVIVVADSVGSARHMALNTNGDIYVKLRGGNPKGIGHRSHGLQRRPGSARERS